MHERIFLSNALLSSFGFLDNLPTAHDLQDASNCLLEHQGGSECALGYGHAPRTGITRNTGFARIPDDSSENDSAHQRPGFCGQPWVVRPPLWSCDGDNMSFDERGSEYEHDDATLGQTNISFPPDTQSHQYELQQPQLTPVDSDFHSNHIAHNEFASYHSTLDYNIFNAQIPSSWVPADSQTAGSFQATLTLGDNFSDILNSPLSIADLPSAHDDALDSSRPNLEMHQTHDPSIFGVEASNELHSQLGAFPPQQLIHSPQQPPLLSNFQPGLPRRRSRYFVSKLQNKTTPVYDSLGVLDPLQRWEQFPPEDEPASVTAIMNAVADTPVAYRSDGSSRGRRKTPSRSRRPRRSVSTTSRDSSASSTDSGWSSAAGSSQTPSRRPKAQSAVPRYASSKPRIFCCTFCCDRFGSKYEWVRHEKSLHVNLENWYCAPFGSVALSDETGKEQCVYCAKIEPSKDHLLEHDHEACQDESNERRFFRRKDHLVQHLRHIHQVQELPPIEKWKIEVKDISSRCGFCDLTLDNWSDRVSHLAKHFHRGLTMKDWKGDHDFPPQVTAQLRNAYPPYLLGWESECIVPFSATNKDVHDQYTPLMSTTINTPNNELEPELPGFLDVFTRHLGEYARSQMELGILPTDEMFQKQARKVLFNSEDAWDQTIADNPDWLAAFRRMHLHNTNSSGVIHQFELAPGSSEPQQSNI